MPALHMHEHSMLVYLLVPPSVHFFMKLFFAAPANFFSAAWVSQLGAEAAAASFSHLVMNAFFAAPASFFSEALTAQLGVPAAAASFSHFVMKLLFAAPASFFSAALASQPASAAKAMLAANNAMITTLNNFFILISSTMVNCNLSAQLLLVSCRIRKRGDYKTACNFLQLSLPSSLGLNKKGIKRHPSSTKPISHVNAANSTKFR